MARGHAAGHGVDPATREPGHCRGVEQQAKGERLARSDDMHIGRAFCGAGNGQDVSSV